MLCDKAEDGRGDAKARVGERHLYAYHRLGAFSAEGGRGHMYDAGIHGRTADAHYHKTCKSKGRMKRYDHQRYTYTDNARAHANKKLVAKTHGEEAVYSPACGDAYIKQTGKG